MTTARSAIAPPGVYGYYHCVSRCVRRAWLCGFDKLTGRSYEHRRQWLVARMNELASIFAVRVLAFTAMSNHLHLALEFDPAWVYGWSNQECAQRWLQLYCPADLTQEQKTQRIDKLLREDGRIDEIRERLVSVSQRVHEVPERTHRPPSQPRGRRHRSLLGGSLQILRLESSGF